MSDASTFIAVAPGWWVTNLGGVVATGLVAARTRRPAFRLLFAGAVALHVGEAVYSYRAAQRAGFSESAGRWAIQTLGVGFPSLLALREARQAQEPAAQ